MANCSHCQSWALAAASMILILVALVSAGRSETGLSMSALGHSFVHWNEGRVHLMHRD